VVELQEEVTQARVAIIMVETRAARAERMAQERAVLLATSCSEADEAAQRVSTLEGKLVAAHRAREMTKEKFLSLSAKPVKDERRWVAIEEQCECLVHELTLLSLRGSELCMTITGAPSQAPLYEGMWFAAARHTEVAMRLSALSEAVSLSAQSILGRLPVDASQAGVVGEMVARFQEQAKWCSCLEASGSRV
jgi:hypothetical protein